MNKGISVLLIEDETDIRMILEYNLKLEGFTVYSASNGREGLEIACKTRPDVILLDWVMPEMNGLEVLSKLRDDERTKGIIVFMLTVKNMLDDVVTALANGANDYIPKPFDGAELGPRIVSMLKAFKALKGDDARESEELMCLPQLGNDL